MAGTLTVGTLSDGTNSTSATNAIMGSAKAWVNFNGTNGSIFSSYNVSSVTRNGTGDYDVNFSSAFSDANYCITASARNAAGIYGVECGQKYTVAQTTTTCRMYCTNDGGGAFDSPYYSAKFHR